jgi:hypothetical protein
MGSTARAAIKAFNLDDPQRARPFTWSPEIASILRFFKPDVDWSRLSHDRVRAFFRLIYLRIRQRLRLQFDGGHFGSHVEAECLVPKQLDQYRGQ